MDLTQEDDYEEPKPKKLKRTDGDQAQWLETLTIQRGVDKRIGKQPVQSTLSFAQRLRKAAEDDDEDVDDK